MAARQQAALAEAHLVVHLELVRRQLVRGLAVEEQEERPGAQWCPTLTSPCWKSTKTILLLTSSHNLVRVTIECT